ncbi:hypothetical protein NFX46_08475 [Streptomyces phaeoluteigriseus]|uniref:DUF3558 domain-containing protein n=1 Tax=Streptomyces phaeoluteigriseus TaxID=114686 RepID=A0ABY4Z4Z8_9ACTN|nr:hypothetical protein [Streptomyces phaeoluteigriseus]USQ83824.1 hypothetical protein NFX46_08475 [Streptomyces phaeoluteigriseus]
MNAHQTDSEKPIRFFAAALISLFLLLTGCANEEQKRDYVIPRTLCGMAVDSDALASFLPAGHKVTVKDSPYPGTKGCQVIVDRILIVTALQMWADEGQTAASVAAGQSFGTLDRSAEEGRYQYSGYEAYGKTQGCVDKKYKQELYVMIEASNAKLRDPDAMKRLIASFTKSVEKSVECTSGAGR